MDTKKFSCIIFFHDGQSPRKYKYVNKLPTFYRFVNRLQGAWYVNVYDRSTAKYLHRTYFWQPDPQDSR